MISRNISKIIPQSAKNFLRQRTLPWRVSKLISPFLTTSICVDVGASYYPHTKWLCFLNAPNTFWLAVEPNKDNLYYVNSWPWLCQVSTCTTGLSSDGGKKTLYITNVDSGSSLLPPIITASMQHRMTDSSYFYPLKEKEIKTITLIQALAKAPTDSPIFVKLDTQGTELSILQGAQTLFDEKRILGIEMESTLLAQPLMQGSGKFWQACEYLESEGFELLHIKPIAAIGKSGKARIKYNTYLTECDAIFMLRQDIAKTLPIEYRINFLAFYLTNFFYEEALSMLENDKGLTQALKQKCCPVDKLKKVLNNSL